MLGSLFKPAWQSPSAEKRLQAIEKLDANDDASDNEGRAVLETLAKEDPELNVRKAAAEKLPALTLFSIASSHPDQETKSHAETIFATLIGPKSQLSEPEFQKLIADEPQTSSWVARLCPFANLRAELLAERSEAELAELISEIDYAETRKIIAERLESIDHLEVARKALKGKDKSAEKIIKSKIDVIRAKEKQDQENHETAEDLCQKMEHLATATKKEWRAEFKRRFLACSSQWDSLDFSPDQDFQKRYQSACDSVAVEADRQEQIDAAHLAQQQLASELEEYCAEVATSSCAQLLDQQQALKDRYAQAFAEWEKLSETVRAHLNIADQFFQAEGALKSLIEFSESVEQSDTAAANNNEPSAEEPNAEEPAEDTPVEVAKAISEDASEKTTTENADARVDEPTDEQPPHRVLEASLSGLLWPKPYPDLAAEAEVQTRLNEIKTALRQEQKTLREKLDKLHKRINRIMGASQRGEIGRARRELEAVTKAAQNYSGKDRSALDDRIEKAAEAVSKMGDWKDFATEPKYIELCDAMEALHDSKVNPDKLADEIKTLQTKWKALGYTGSSEKHWDRFKAAGDKAYEPCAKFFQERKDTRKQNLKLREPLVAKTQALLDETDWEGQPDYKAIETEVRRIGDDWKKIKDVEPRGGQKQWKRFCALKDAVYEKLAVVYDANIAVKEQLIEQAAALNETELNEQSLTRLQQLQARWKQVGVTRRKDDQAAWKKFKAATDAVYEKIQGIRQLKRDEENQQLDGYRSIIKQIQSLAKNAKDLAEADHSFERLQADYQELPPLPKGLPEKLLEGIEKDYQRACDSYARGRDRILEAAGKEELNALKEKVRLCSELEKLAGEGGKETDIENLKSDIGDIEIHDKALQKQFDQRLATALDKDKTEATERRRLLCIDLEILLGVESPDEDRELRMKIQFDRMQTQGIGKGNLDKKTIIEESRLNWLCLPGATPEVQVTLDKRFQKLLS